MDKTIFAKKIHAYLAQAAWCFLASFMVIVNRHIRVDVVLNHPINDVLVSIVGLSRLPSQYKINLRAWESALSVGLATVHLSRQEPLSSRYLLYP